MKALPLSIGTLHFIGIGGIGMSGIAEILHNLGYSVQGSDMAENANVQRLKKLGIRVFIGHDAAHVEDASVVVFSSAVKTDNPEMKAARAKLIPLVRRAEMLAELMRLKWSVAVGGTHGKTTTTSIIASMFDTAGLDPTVINGGIINAYGTNARLGSGDWMVVEADESDGTFTKLPSTIAVVTNIDPEHMDFYGTFDALRKAFVTFIENIPFYGFAMLCLDHAEVQSLIPKVADRRIITYGFSPQADIRGINLRPDRNGTTFDVTFTDRASANEIIWKNFYLPMAGSHNVQNAVAAIGVAREMDIPESVMRTALAQFKGVKRRFTRTGEVNGVVIVDDYAHHPVEIAAVLKAARSACGEGRIIAVVQPHRYSRLMNLFEEFCTCFNDADVVIVADVYAAGEAPLPDVNRETLIEGLRTHGHRSVKALREPSALAPMIAKLATSGDMVVCLGAGNITAWAHALPEELAALDAPAGKKKSGESS